MHSLASSPTNMHYINALHCGNPTKTCPQSGIGPSLSSFKKLQRLSKASKSFLRQRSIHNQASRPSLFQKLQIIPFTPCILYEMTNHLLEQVESQCLFKASKNLPSKLIFDEVTTLKPKYLKNAPYQLRRIFKRLLWPSAHSVGV